METNRSTAYAILAVGYVARHQKDGIVLSQRISKEHNIPLAYLLRIMQLLAKNNILRSKRGPRGGFLLAKPAEKINLLQIIEAVEGPMLSHLEITEQAPKDKFAINAEQTYDKAILKIRDVFEKTKLSTLLKS